jgi:autotransporter-associated beta strand protein/T5SS/PEP-CTERM-associated repeat protein
MRFTPERIRRFRCWFLATARLASGICLIALLAVPPVAEAADIEWTATTGSYLDPANWSTATVPAAGDVAIIANGGTSTLTLDSDLDGPQINVGFNGTGTLVVEGSGTATASALSSIGYATADSLVAGDGRLEIGSGTTVRLIGPGTVGGGGGSVGGTGTVAIAAGGEFVLAADGQRLYIGDTIAGNTSTGTFDVEGTFSVIAGEIEVGRGQGGGGQGLGTINVPTGGVFNTNNWTKFGTKPFDSAGGGGLGQLVISGGTVNKTGGGNIVFGDFNGTGEIEQTGGLFNVANGSLYVGSYGTSGIGSYTLSAGTLEVASGELSIGKSNGSGTLTMTGGSIVKRGSADFEIGDGGSGTGTVTISGGTVDVLGGDVAVGKFGGIGTLSIEGTGVMRAGNVVLSKSGSSLLATVNLGAGGRLEAAAVTSADIFSTTAFNFNGGRLVATADSNAFMADIFTATINDTVTGAVIDTQGFTVTMPQPLGGVGGLVKEGAGTLDLTGAGSYFGPTSVTAGTLGLSTAHTGSGEITVAADATLGVNVASLNSQLFASALTLGADSAITFDLGSFGNPGESFAPLSVSGSLTTGGDATVINFASAAPAPGTVPLIQYGSLDSYSFTLGSLPAGVQATLIDNTAQNRIDLLIAGVSVRRWQGDVSSQWNTTEANWLDSFTGVGSAVTFADGDGPVIFDDSATGATDVTLEATVLPLETQFTNESLAYSLSGAGSIGGSGGLTKTGAGDLTLATANTFTGPVRLVGGTTSIATVADAGVASPLGAGTADPTNLVLEGGRLAYTGATGATDRGFSIIAGSGSIAVTEAATVLTVSGQMNAVEGSFLKTGPGTLRLAGDGITNTLATVESGIGVTIEAGTLALEGTGADATSLVNALSGELHVGSSAGQAASLTVTNATLDVGSWISIGHDTGAANTSASLTGATVTAANLRLGFGDPANSGTHALTLADSSLEVGNEVLIANIGPSVGTLSLTGTSSIRSGGNFLVGNTADTQGTVTVADSSTLTSVGQLRVGDGGSGQLTASGSAALTVDQVLIGNATGSTGTLSLGDSAVLQSSGYIAVGNAGTGTLDLSGNANLTVQFDLNVADFGTGTLTLADTATAAAGSLFAGKNPDTSGDISVSGGQLLQTAADGSFIVGRDGAGTLTIGGTGQVVAAATGGLVLAATSTSQTGAVNLDGGVLEVARISRGSGTGAVVSFNGGTLRASATADGTFISGLDNLLILPGGATIDSAGRTISVDQPFIDAGGGGLTKAGEGTLVLAADSFYSGPTAVAAGTLRINGNNALAVGPVSVAADGTLGGSGTVGGVTSLGGGATLAPGNSPGNLTFAQGLTLADGGNYNWQLANAAGTAGIAWDTVTVAGTLDITATSADPFAINLWTLSSTGPDVDGPAANFDPTTSYSWRIATAASITGFSEDAFEIVTTSANGTAGFANSTSGGTFSLALAGNDLNLLFTPGSGPTDIIIDVPSGTETQAEAGYPTIGAATSVTKIGAGTVVFDAANAYSGPTTISAGTLEVAAADALAATNVTVDSAATLSIAAGTTMRSPSVIVDGGTLAAAGLAINDTTGITSLAINAGTLAGSPAVTIDGGGELALVQDARVSVAVGSLAVTEGSGGGRLDLGAGQVAIAAGGITAEDLRADIIAGRNGGAWNGSAGIMSSAAAASGGSRAVGYVVAGDGSATISFAAPGDTDLSGQVNVFDLIEIDSAGKFGNGQAAVWSQGDFNYDGVSNVFDLIGIDSSGAYGTGPYFPASPTVAGGLGQVAAVPEPGLLAVLGGALAGLAYARRRRTT